MSGFFYGKLSGDMPYFIFLLNVKKRVECKIKAQNTLHAFIIHDSQCQIRVTY